MKQLFPIMKRLGATGLLIEYEDMFPYGAPIEHLSAGNAYTIVEVREMLSAAAGMVHLHQKHLHLLCDRKRKRIYKI